MQRVYLDYAASAPLRPEARAALLSALDGFGNPSSVHAEGQRARALLDDARRDVADVLGVRSERVVLCGGGTEANNLALRGMHAKLGGKQMLVSAVEHDCVRNTALALGAEEMPVGPDGVLDLAALRVRLGKGDVGLVCVMHANNENGVLQPVLEAARLAHAHGALLHCDAVQTVGHMMVDFAALEVDSLSFSGHKFGGPRGAGALLVKDDSTMAAVMTGGGQERNRRAGTENVPALCGMATALRTACAQLQDELRLAHSIQAAIIAGLAMVPGVQVVAPQSPRVAHIVQFLQPGRAGEDTVIALDMRGVAASQGSACSSGRSKESHVLRAMGFDTQAAGEGVRLSWGWASALEDVAYAMEALRALAPVR